MKLWDTKWDPKGVRELGSLLKSLRKLKDLELELFKATYLDAKLLVANLSKALERMELKYLRLDLCNL